MSNLLDADDVKVIATGIIIVLIVGVLLIVLAGAAGLAVAVFDAVRNI